MKRFPRLIGMAASLLLSIPLLADDQESTPRPRVARFGRDQAAAYSAQAVSYSAEVPVVARVQGTAFFRTMIDVNNNTTQTISVAYQYSYSCATSCGGNNFFRTPVITISIPGAGNFHQDDFIQYLSTLSVNGQAVLQPGAIQSIGTLLLTFSNVTPFGSGGVILGSEVTVVARTYNHLDETTQSSATVGFAYNASLFFESAGTTLVGSARDTKGSVTTTAGRLRSNVGVRNTDINGTNQAVTLVLTFYDAATGQKIPGNVTMSNLQPGEVRQISDLWATANIPSTTNQVIIFVDNPTPTATSATFEGFVNIVDGGSATSGTTAGIATQDASFFEMKCADADGCGN